MHVNADGRHLRGNKHECQHFGEGTIHLLHIIRLLMFNWYIKYGLILVSQCLTFFIFGLTLGQKVPA